MKYDIKFDKTNANCIIIKENDKTINYIACPPIKKGCDIINYDDILNKGYTHNFEGLIIITTKEKRELYYRGELIDSIKRNI